MVIHKIGYNNIKVGTRIYLPLFPDTTIFTVIQILDEGIMVAICKEKEVCMAPLFVYKKNLEDLRVV